MSIFSTYFYLDYYNLGSGDYCLFNKLYFPMKISKIYLKNNHLLNKFIHFENYYRIMMIKDKQLTYENHFYSQK